MMQELIDSIPKEMQHKLQSMWNELDPEQQSYLKLVEDSLAQ